MDSFPELLSVLSSDTKTRNAKRQGEGPVPLWTLNHDGVRHVGPTGPLLKKLDLLIPVPMEEQCLVYVALPEVNSGAEALMHWGSAERSRI